MSVDVTSIPVGYRLNDFDELVKEDSELNQNENEETEVNKLQNFAARIRELEMKSKKEHGQETISE
jgi:hypothetical protein